MKLNRDYTFKNYYIVGYNNKNVREAISSAMTMPGQIYNPIFLYGSIVVGKTHLLQALAQEYMKDMKIYYATIEEFINSITQALQNHRYVDFIERIMGVDVLLIDDIHLVKNKKDTLEELLHIFGQLYEARKQIIISADRLPTQIFNTQDKTYGIFQKGLVFKIQPPSYRDRLKFLQAKAQNAGLLVNSKVLKDLARKTNLDFRENRRILKESRKTRHET